MTWIVTLTVLQNNTEKSLENCASINAQTARDRVENFLVNKEKLKKGDNVCLFFQIFFTHQCY